MEEAAAQEVVLAAVQEVVWTAEQEAVCLRALRRPSKGRTRRDSVFRWTVRVGMAERRRPVGRRRRLARAGMVEPCLPA